jgi:hypothetical protein
MSIAGTSNRADSADVSLPAACRARSIHHIAGQYLREMPLLASATRADKAARIDRLWFLKYSEASLDLVTISD